MDACRRICAIRAKKSEHKIIESLTEEETKAILEAIGSDTLWDQRDYALILLMYNTGARVQELADLTIEDLKVDGAPQVKLKGKGRKERIVPLWEETVRSAQPWLKTREQAGISAEHLFVNSHRRQISRFGIAHILSKYASMAAEVRLTKKQERHTTYDTAHNGPAPDPIRRRHHRRERLARTCRHQDNQPLCRHQHRDAAARPWSNALHRESKRTKRCSGTSPKSWLCCTPSHPRRYVE